MPEQGIPTKGAIDGSVLSAAEGIFDLIDDDGLAAVGIDGGDEGIGIPSAERERRKAEAEGTEEPSDEADDFDDEAASALQGDEPEGEDADEESEEEAEDESEDEADEEGEAADEDPLVTVKVDGEERQVPLSEALRGYSSTASYTRKSQALAEERKGFEAEREAVQQERIKLDAYLRQAETLLQANLPKEPGPDNPQAWIRYQQEVQRLQEVQQRRAKLHQDMQAEQDRQQQDFVASELKALSEEIDGWNDGSVMKAEMKALADYAIGTLGFEEEDVAQIKDRRVVKLLRKAKAYDEVTAKAGEAKKKVKSSKTLQPGKPSRKPAAKTKAQREMRSKAKTLRETGRVRDAAALFEDMLGDDI